VSLDLLCLGVLLAGAAVGALSGALRQVVHLLAIGAAALLGPRLAPSLEGLVARLVPPGAAPHAALLAGFVLALAGTKLVGHLLNRLLAGDGEKSGTDRGVGALLGALQATVGLWAMLSLLVLWDRPVGRPPVRLDPRDGQLAALARAHNLVDLVAPAQARELRSRLPHLRDALDDKMLERVREATRKAQQLEAERLRQIDKVGK